TVTAVTPTSFSYALGTPGLVASGGGLTQVGYNGTYAIASVPTPTTFTYTLGTTGFANSGGAVSNITAAAAAVVTGANALNLVIATITTGAAHGLVPGQTVA